MFVTLLRMAILDFLFPKRCISCKTFGSYLCANCLATLSFDTRIICLVCGKYTINGATHPVCQTKYAIDGVFCGLLYTTVAKKLVYVFKYEPYLSDIQTLLVDLLYESIIQNERFVQAATIHALFVPIPLSSAKLKKRGYNQAALLTKGLAKKFTIPIADCLLRVKETRPQFGLTKQQRKENMQGVFALNRNHKIAQANTIFLVDDVLTTGSTLLEAAKVLKKMVVNVYGELPLQEMNKQIKNRPQKDGYVEMSGSDPESKNISKKLLQA